ncbi:MAG: glycine cleavage system aminomethyltransferase GcvT, partial [Anaerolineales bacterium]|nr:glycine cleavage system aminomethyltransferase GcvT [Anaerolineales bacterium]
MPKASPDDFLFRQQIEEISPFVSDLIHWEDERQARKLIFIPSQSYVPQSVRDALSTRFQNLYAEGYPPTQMTLSTEDQLKDVPWQLANYRRYADRRFYKGKEYVNFLECLAQRKAAQLFAREGLSPDDIYVNVQALSGTPANLAVYWSLMEPGDTFMGLDLYQGGHLSHGSEFNISGQRYKVVSYGVDPKTERLDYDAIRDLALAHRPKILLAGYTSYPWAPDWGKFRSIANEIDAYLMADISHVAGMAAAGEYPNPVGIADVVTFTTHKTMMGPRGAVIMTTDEELAGKIDLAVFPGEQGGPHVNKFAAMAIAFEIAATDKFKALQKQIIRNAQALAEGLQNRGLRLAYGGTDTHLLLLDLKSIPTVAAPPTGIVSPIWGEPAVRIMDLAGMVANKNTIPGDLETSLATGIRLGTPWLTQRGLIEQDMDILAGLIHKLLSNLKSFSYNGLIGVLPRAKVDLEILEEVKFEVAEVADRAGIDFEVTKSGYPHHTIKDQGTPGKNNQIRIIGWRARQHLNQVVTSNLINLNIGETISTFCLDGSGELIDEIEITREGPDDDGRDQFLLTPSSERCGSVLSWLRGLGDGYTLFDDLDLFRKIEGPVIVEEVEGNKEGSDSASAPGIPARELYRKTPEKFDLTKPYFIGQDSLLREAPKSSQNNWSWKEKDLPVKMTKLNSIHKDLGARMVPFAGWEMPVRYTSIMEEHRAVRQTAGLFDVSHMGVFEISGPNATTFLDVVFSNYAAWLNDGQSMYGYFLEPNGNVVDDGIIYKIRSDFYYLVINASNEAKDWDWLNAVNDGKVVLDQNRPWIKVEASAVLRNLKDPKSGKDQMRDIALQGPASIKILQAMAEDPGLRKDLGRLRRTELISCKLIGIPVVIARTGYTGETWGFEILVHPDKMDKLWTTILEKGEPYGIKPAGLACRDSTRIEAGLPLYGQELAGPLSISPVEAGFPGYVKYHKPFFIGRDVLLSKEGNRSREIIRFRCNQKRCRRPNTGDPVVDERGVEIGKVTSCSLDEEGYLVGLALVDKRCTIPGIPLVVFPLHGKSLQEGIIQDNKIALAIDITIIPRFPVKEDK